jgi:ABC-type branched-subunit amino acid transport system ATPase component
VVLDFGQKIAEDTPQNIRVNEVVVSAYLGGYLEGEREANAGS